MNTDMFADLDGLGFLNGLDGLDYLEEFHLDDITQQVKTLGSEGTSSDDQLLTKKRRNRKRAAHELCFLREQVTELTQKLESLQASQADIIKTSPSVWEERSKRQASQRKAVEHENQTLKSLLERQLKVTESLMKLVSKRPRLSEMTYLEKWKSRKLVRDPIERHKTLHAILDEKYGKLESVFIANQLLDVNENTTRTNVSYEEESKDIVFDFSAIEYADADYLKCAQSIWEFYSSDNESQYEKMTLLERIGDDIFLSRLQIKVPKYGIEVYQHYACKRYHEDNHVVIVSESILDDDLYPYPNDVYVSRESTWYVVSKLGKNRSLSTFHAHGHLPCRSSREDNETIFDDRIHTMAFAEHMLDDYKRTLDRIVQQICAQMDPIMKISN